MNTSTSPHDVFLWPDGSWCFQEDREEYTWMSDDYQVLVENSEEWEEFFI